MQITTHTNYDEVRAILGVSDEEIEDSTLALPMWADLVEFKLDAISELILESYSSISAISESSRTADQAKFLKTVDLYVGYLFAEELLTSQPMFGFKRTADGKSETERFDAWEDVKSGVTRTSASIKVKVKYLLSKVSNYELTSTSVPMLIGTGIAVNPITNK